MMTADSKAGIAMGPAALFSLRDCLAEKLHAAIPPDRETALGALLDRVVVSHNKASTTDLEVRPNWQYSELIDACRTTLLKRDGPKNALTEGYILANSHGGSSAVHSSGSNVNNSIIKSHEWRQLHHCIGNVLMGRLLTTFSAYEQKGGHIIHLFGDVWETTQFKTKHPPFFSLDRALYQEVYKVKYLSPLPGYAHQLLKIIFKQEFQRQTSTNKLPPSIKGFRKLATQIISSHKSQQYIHIFNNICPEPQMKCHDNIDLSIFPCDVVRFTTVMFEKVFPTESYGCSSHKSVIFGCLSKLINGEKGTKLSLEECLSGIKISKIPWLGKKFEGKMSKQDTEKRIRLLHQFIGWLFTEFFPKILASFFHITHISSGKELIYFRHDTWKRLSGPYLEKYASENFSVVPAPVSASQVATTGILPSTLRIMPKKNNDFRAISVPRRGHTKDEITRYNDHIFKEIRPAKRILNNIRIKENSLFPKLTSVSKIPVQVAKFRKRMIQKTGLVPNLFFLKFDARSCYDTLPQDKILDIVSEMVVPDKPYYYSEEMNLQLESIRAYQEKKNGHLKDIMSLKSMKKTPSLLNSRRQYVLSGSEIVDICRSQLEDTITKSNNVSYSRSKGVHQGMHMSSLFCDLVYDSLIQEHFGFLANTDSLVLRIADDFLVISSELDLLVKMRAMATAGFPDYGVTINAFKSAVNFGSQSQGGSFLHSFTFCGYKIDIDSLDIIKEYGPSMYYLPCVKSQREVLNSMVRIFKIRIRQNTLDTELNHPEKIFEQLGLLSKNLAHSYYKTAKAVRISITGFEQMIHEVLKEAQNNLRGKERNNGRIKSSLKAVILNAFISQLQRRPKFRSCINVLSKELERSRCS